MSNESELLLVPKNKICSLPIVKFPIFLLDWHIC